DRARYSLTAVLAHHHTAVIRCVPPRPSADENDALAGEPLGLRVDRGRVGEERPQVVRLPPDRLAHDAHRSALISPPPTRLQEPAWTPLRLREDPSDGGVDASRSARG